MHQVQDIETRRNAQKYDTGKVDGYCATATFHAVMTFQKVHGLSRTGRATDDVLNLIRTVGAPGPPPAAGGAPRAEVDPHPPIPPPSPGARL